MPCMLFKCGYNIKLYFYDFLEEKYKKKNEQTRRALSGSLLSEIS